ncbi:unnamed protein product [Rangifer tarandus platyrhynchus]|uniref:Uncharacterized protein n=1 Tax=Rangifer tarandus platyrhynchus TaxID=3082113 RepID=A0AC59ZYQ2_RANTA
MATNSFRPTSCRFSNRGSHPSPLTHPGLKGSLDLAFGGDCFVVKDTSRTWGGGCTCVETPVLTSAPHRGPREHLLCCLAVSSQAHRKEVAFPGNLAFCSAFSHGR